MASHIFKNELGLYLLFSEKTINDCAFEFDMKPRELKAFIWCYYFNKFVTKRPFISTTGTIPFFKIMGNDLPKHANTLNKILAHMEEKGYLERIGKNYRIDDTTSRAFANKMTRVFQQHLIDFQTYAENPKIKYRRPKTGRHKKVGVRKRIKHEQKKEEPLS